MSSHPNVMLQCVLTVNDGTRKTQRALEKAFPGKYGGDIKVGERNYSLTVMESDYEEGYQISADEGQIVLHIYLTYDYGETVTLDEIQAYVDPLRAWAEEAKGPHGFTYEIRIGANYW